MTLWQRNSPVDCASGRRRDSRRDVRSILNAEDFRNKKTVIINDGEKSLWIQVKEKRGDV